ncbi:MAG: hypothetical protein ACKO03_03780 [Bacteroidota bacterium]
MCHQVSFSQERFETGFSLGSMQYEGEVGGRFYSQLGDLANRTSRPRMAFGGNIGFHFNQYFTFRSSLTLGSVQGADRLLEPGLSAKLDYKILRNLSFRSTISEFSLVSEFYPMPLISRGYEKVQGKFNPFLVLGVSGFLFNPKSIYTASSGEQYWVALKPLRTEGQGMGLPESSPEYKLSSTAILWGLGLRYDINRSSAISIEWVNRRTNTDFIDDVSGKYIVNDEFERFFGVGSIKADQAKQKANYPAYINGVHIPGFLPGQQRGSINSFNDYYYTVSFKYHYYFDAQKLLGNISHGTRSALDCYNKF